MYEKLTICPNFLKKKILARKITRMPEFVRYLSEKLTKFPFFGPKNARILHKNIPKIFFTNFRGHVPPYSPCPTPMCIASRVQTPLGELIALPHALKLVSRCGGGRFMARGGGSGKDREGQRGRWKKKRRRNTFRELFTSLTQYKIGLTD